MQKLMLIFSFLIIILSQIIFIQGYLLMYVIKFLFCELWNINDCF